MTTNAVILHPNIYYIGDSWSSVNSLEYWNKGNTVTTNNNNPVYKTLYSPSPTGFVEPKTAAFTGFTSSGGNQTSGFNVSGSFNKGWNFYCQPNATGGTVFFSSLGYRAYNTGAVAYVSGYGVYWSAGPSGTPTFARLLDILPGYVYPQDEYSRASGFSVRSASE